MNLELTTQEAFELLAALELSPLDHERLLQRVLDLVYSRDVRSSVAASATPVDRRGRQLGLLTTR